MGKESELTLGDIGCTNATLLKDVMEAVYKEGFRRGMLHTDKEMVGRRIEFADDGSEVVIQE